MMELEWRARIRSSIQKRATDEWRSVFLYLDSAHCSAKLDSEGTLKAEQQTNMTAIDILGDVAAVQAAVNPLSTGERAKVSNARTTAQSKLAVNAYY